MNLADVKIKNRLLNVVEKGGNMHGYKISKQGHDAIKDYLKKEREGDNKKWHSPALFLPANNEANATGQLSVLTISKIWNEVCKVANIRGKTPHSARHAMGKHIIEKTGNVAAVQRHLGHINAANSMLYARISYKELEEVLDER